jgi:hypothetical protein
VALAGFKAQNHPQQVGKRGARPEVDNLETTVEMFAPLNERFRFTIDVAALPHNAKLPRYFTPEQDGLAQLWAGERVWCNPPYSDIEPWVEKAWREWNFGADLIVMLLPANRTEQGFWQRWIEPFRDGNGTRPGEVYVPLSNCRGRALIEEADLPLVTAHRWRLDSTGYVVTSLPRVEGKNRNLHLHRLLAGLERGDGSQCDHVNRDRLDNRRSNLRVAAPHENGRNRNLYSNNTTGYKGVSFDKRSGRWEASIKVDYRKQFLGLFDSAEEAGAAYDAASVQVHGLFASPNTELGGQRGHLRVEFLPGRPRFIKYGFDKVEPNQRPPFGCCLLIWERSS